MKILLPVTLVIALIALFLFKNPLPQIFNNSQNSFEETVAKEHDGTNAFLEQIKNSSGQWQEFVYNWAGPAISGGTTVLNSTPDNPGVRVVAHE